MTTIIIIAALLFALYLGIAIACFGLPESLSETHYLYGERFASFGKCLFPVFMVAFCGLLMPSVLDVTDGSEYQFLGFLMLAALMFVGVAPCFRLSFEGRVHTVAAVMSAVFGMSFSIVFGGWVYVAFFGIITAGLIYKYRPFYVVLLEISAFASIIMTIIALP